MNPSRCSSSRVIRAALRLLLRNTRPRRKAPAGNAAEEAQSARADANTEGFCDRGSLPDGDRRLLASAKANGPTQTRELRPEGSRTPFSYAEPEICAVASGSTQAPPSASRSTGSSCAFLVVRKDGRRTSTHTT